MILRQDNDGLSFNPISSVDISISVSIFQCDAIKLFKLNVYFSTKLNLSFFFMDHFALDTHGLRSFTHRTIKQKNRIKPISGQTVRAE